MPKQTSNPTLGVVAISYNEERDLPGFLENLIPWIDEIIIIDDGSTDNTSEIAKEAGEKVAFIRSPRIEGQYFADQRNKGIDAAESDWLIHMDVDERVPPDLATEITKAIREPNFDAYRYRRQNYFLHRPMRGGNWQDWNQIHLAKRKVLRFSGMYHEKVELAVPDDKVGQLKNCMIHLNDESYEERLRKSAIYQREIAGKLEERNKSLGYFDIWQSFIWEFIYQYIWKRGFLDGVLGLVWAFHAASAKTRAYTLAWDKQKRIPREKLEKKIRLKWDQDTLKRVLRQKKFHQHDD